MRQFLMLIMLSATVLSYAAPIRCSNPIAVSVTCPKLVMQNQTTVGAGNNAPAWVCGALSGNDLVYEITAPANSVQLNFSISTTDNFEVFFVDNVCGSSSCSDQYSVTPGTHTFSFVPTSPTGPYYLWIDHANAGDVTFDIGFGVQGPLSPVSIPDTRGNWEYDDSGICTTDPFSGFKPYFEVTWNGAFQYDPMTLAPLGSPGTMCIKRFMRNTTGDEGIKKIKFDFGPDLTSVSPVATVVPGSYNAGDWYLTDQTSSSFTYQFLDDAGSGRGDFTGTPNTCLSYEFCFTLTPVSNDPYYTTVDDTVYSDGWGYPYTGNASTTYCCADLFPTSCTSSPGGGGGSSSIGGGFTDPPILPVDLQSFQAINLSNSVKLNWTTTSEKNFSHFEVERSIDGKLYKNIAKVETKSQSTSINDYEFWDYEFNQGVNYYRLKMVDLDNKFNYSDVISLDAHGTKNPFVSPNPVQNELTIRKSGVEGSFSIVDCLGKTVYRSESVPEKLNISNLKKGIYFIRIVTGSHVFYEEFVKD